MYSTLLKGGGGGEGRRRERAEGGGRGIEVGMWKGEAGREMTRGDKRWGRREKE